MWLPWPFSLIQRKRTPAERGIAIHRSANADKLIAEREKWQRRQDDLIRRQDDSTIGLAAGGIMGVLATNTNAAPPSGWVAPEPGPTPRFDTVPEGEILGRSSIDEKRETSFPAAAIPPAETYLAPVESTDRHDNGTGYSAPSYDGGSSSYDGGSSSSSSDSGSF